MRTIADSWPFILVGIRICIEATAGRHDPYVDGRYVLAFWQRYQPWVSTCPWC